MHPLLTPEQLREKIQEAAKYVEIGASYQHYRGDTYIVSGIVLLEAEREAGVVYYSADATDIPFVRALSVWLEEVEYNDAQVKRFTKLT